MKRLSVNLERNKNQAEEYKKALLDSSDKELIAEFFSYLDYTEVSDSGREFHPISLSSARCMITKSMSMCLQEMRKRISK